jgi:hypothetical protein
MVSIIDKVRYEMFWKRVVSWREKRDIVFLKPGMEAQRQVVMKALGPQHDLWGRMADCGSIDMHKNMRTCGVPLCPRCFMRRRKKETAIATQRSFAGIRNEELVFCTLLARVTTILSDASGIIEDEKRRVINMVDSKRRKDGAWNDVHVVGWWEMERLTAEDLPTQGRNTRIALEHLGAPVLAMAGTTIWRPHLHAIVALGSVARDDFTEALREYGHGGAYQVDVKAFRSETDVGENISSIVRYCLKFRIEEDYKAPDSFDYGEQEEAERLVSRERNWWPSKDIRAYAEWLSMDRSGFHSLRFTKGSK